MTIFTDHCVNRDVVWALRNSGFKVISAVEVNLERASDAEIFSYATTHNSTLLTFDKDFGNILRFNIKSSWGVIIIYVEEMKKEEIVKNTLDFFNKFDETKIIGQSPILRINNREVVKRGLPEVLGGDDGLKDYLLSFCS